MSSPVSASSRPRRTSRFTEGTPLTLPDMQQQSPTSIEHFRSMLSEMDDYEKKHRHRGSNSSVESLATTNGASLRKLSAGMEFVPKEASRNINFGTGSNEVLRRSMDERPSVVDIEQKLSKFKGRLRALTGGRDKDMKSYPGTWTTLCAENLKISEYRLTIFILRYRSSSGG